MTAPACPAVRLPLCAPQAATRSITCQLCQAPPGAACSHDPAGDHLLRWGSARMLGLVSKADLSLAFERVTVITRLAVVPQYGPYWYAIDRLDAALAGLQRAIGQYRGRCDRAMLARVRAMVDDIDDIDALDDRERVIAGAVEVAAAVEEFTADLAERAA